MNAYERAMLADEIEMLADEIEKAEAEFARLDALEDPTDDEYDRWLALDESIHHMKRDLEEAEYNSPDAIAERRHNQSLLYPGC